MLSKNHKSWIWLIFSGRQMDAETNPLKIVFLLYRRDNCMLMRKNSCTIETQFISKNKPQTVYQATNKRIKLLAKKVHWIWFITLLKYLTHFRGKNLHSACNFLFMTGFLLSEFSFSSRSRQLLNISDTFIIAILLEDIKGGIGYLQCTKMADRGQRKL